MGSSRSEAHTAVDVQSRRPGVPLRLSQVGISGVEKVIRLQHDGVPQLFSARFECVVELGPGQKGAHMSRFEEVVNEAIGQVVLGEIPFRAETLAEHIAQLVRARQRASRAEVTLHARIPVHKPAPVSGTPTQELYTLHGCAVASQLGTRKLTGVSAQGMTACPCAQELVAAGARARLEEQGYSAREIARILDAVPVATHNQRGIGTLHIGLPEGAEIDLDASALVEIVLGAMSSETYELMKRADEAYVVEKAHRHPRFVEDCVREMVSGVVGGFPALPDQTFVCARQENLETIHHHNVIAERSGTLGRIRAELRDRDGAGGAGAQTTLRAWLDAH